MYIQYKEKWDKKNYKNNIQTYNMLTNFFTFFYSQTF